MCVSVTSTDSEWRQYSQNGNIVQSEWRNYTVHRMETLYRLETLYSQNGDTIVRMETLYSQNGDTIQSKWRQYTVRIETLYSQNGDTIQPGDTIQSGWRHYTDWRHYTVRMQTLYRLETLYSQNGNAIQTGDSIQSEWRHLQSVWRHYKIKSLYPGHCSLITVPLRLYNNSEYHKWHKNTLSGQNAKFWKVKTHAVNTYLFKFKMPVMWATNETQSSKQISPTPLYLEHGGSRFFRNAATYICKRPQSQYLLYAFFWVIPRRLNFICRRFGTLSVPST